MTPTYRARSVSNGNSYTPAPPLTASWTSTMSQDVVTTASIPVDSTSSTPVAPFTNPANSQAEALVISSIESAGNQLCHVARDAATDGGWRLVPLFGGRVASEVAAGTAYAGTSAAAVYGCFLDGSGLSVTQLQTDGVTWSSPQSIYSGAGGRLRTAYSPDGRLVLYCADSKGDLVVAYQPQIGGPFTASACTMNGSLAQGDFQFCMTDETTWQVATNLNGQPLLFLGQLGASSYSGDQQMPQFQGTLKQIALGYWSASQNTIMYLLVDDDDALHVWASNSASSVTVSQPILNSKVSSAIGHVGTDGSLNVYSIDTNQGLWVLHQSPTNPWNADGTPNWAPYIAIDAGRRRRQQRHPGECPQSLRARRRGLLPAAPRAGSAHLDVAERFGAAIVGAGVRGGAVPHGDQHRRCQRQCAAIPARDRIRGPG